MVRLKSSKAFSNRPDLRQQHTAIMGGPPAFRIGSQGVVEIEQGFPGLACIRLQLPAAVEGPAGEFVDVLGNALAGSGWPAPAGTFR